MMRRWHVMLLSWVMITFLAVFTGWNGTAADDQSVDFRFSQIMVKLGQIEWELSNVKNRVGTQENRFDQIDRRLDRILEKIEENAASTVTAAAPAAPDLALVGMWRLSHSDFSGEDTAERVRRFLQGTETDTAQLDSQVREFVNRVELALDLIGLRSIRFSSDASYADDSGGLGIWSVYGDRLIRIGEDGEVSQATYLASGSSLSVLFTRYHILKALKAESETWTNEDQELFNAAFEQRDGLRVTLTRDE